MIHGAHVIVYSKDADADRAFFKDVMKYRFADAGHGWLIFALPPAEIAVHPAESNGRHELYLMCDDVEAFVADMTKRGFACGAVTEQRWGLLTSVTLPSGGELGVYEPRHASPIGAPKKPAGAKRTKKTSATKKTVPAKKTATKKKATKKTKATKKKARR